MRKSTLLAASLALVVLGSVPATAQTAGVVGVRAGAHDDFDRIVFDWPRDVKFQFKRDGDKGVLVFDSAASIKFGADVQNNLSRARGFSAKTDENGKVTVSFALAPASSVKTFTSNHSVVVDVSGKAAPAPKQEAAAPEPKPEPKAEAAAPEAVADTTVATGKPQPLIPPQAKPAAAKEVAPAPKPQPAPAPVKEAAPIIPPKSTVAATVDAAPAPVVATETAAVAKPAASVVPAPAFVQNPVIGAMPSFTPGDEPTLVATLDSHAPLRALIYQRAQVGYIVFDRKLTLTPAQLENGIPALIDIQAFSMPKNSGYRFAMPPGADLLATLDGTVWKIFISKKLVSLPVTTSLVAQPDFALGARYLLPLPDPPEPIRMTDPVVGDDLILIPLTQSEAFNTERLTSDFTILPAAQGMVIKPLNDKLLVRPVSDGVEITAEGGLLMSRAADSGTVQATSNKTKPVTGKSIFDFTTWRGKPNENFTKGRQRLQQVIVDVPEAERNRARLELARFYFSHGFGEESVSLLNLLVKQVPDLKAHADFRALMGAAKVLAYRPDDGLTDLAFPGLSDTPEVGLWQAVAYAQLRDWPHAEEKFALRENVLSGYPDPFFSRFFVLAIEAALAANKDREASDWLEYITKAPHLPTIEPALSYLRGVIHAKAGRAGAAEASWKEAQRSNDRLYKVRAELALVDLGVSSGSLTPAQAADRLEAMRFGWRGDDLEVDILHRLGQFYVQAKNVKAGLNAMSQAVTLYPSSQLVPAVRAEMAATFHDVFLGPLARKLSPLDGLTLYQQYRSLMPSGHEGDEVMKNLAERLVAVDLLDQASSILEDLTKNRLQGEERVRAALRLAGIRLLDHKPTEAISAIDILGNENLPTAAQNERILLRARALSELHRDDDASALLRDNPTPAARMLRADIAMHGQKWAEAAKILMDLVGAPPTPGTVLTLDQAGWLLNAAIAFALSGDQAGLDRLAIDFTAAMAGQPQKDTFLMLTRQEKRGQLRDLAAAQAQISQVDMFQGFLNNYRTSVSTDTTAPKNP